MLFLGKLDTSCFPKNFKTLIVLESQLSFVKLVISKSSTCWIKKPFVQLKSLNYLARAFPNKWRLSPKPWGRTVQMHGEFSGELGSVHSNADKTLAIRM